MNEDGYSNEVLTNLIVIHREFGQVVTRRKIGIQMKFCYSRERM